jgi:hypothetical protein
VAVYGSPPQPIGILLRLRPETINARILWLCKITWPDPTFVLPPGCPVGLIPQPSFRHSTQWASHPQKISAPAISFLQKSNRPRRLRSFSGFSNALIYTSNHSGQFCIQHRGRVVVGSLFAFGVEAAVASNSKPAANTTQRHEQRSKSAAEPPVSRAQVWNIVARTVASGRSGLIRASSQISTVIFRTSGEQ